MTRLRTGQEYCDKLCTDLAKQKGVDRDPLRQGNSKCKTRVGSIVDCVP